MALRPRSMHEQLNGYLFGPGGVPTQVPTPSASPRHAMAPPNADVPQGRRPIPASSEGPKKTNAQIPVARMVVKPDTAPNPFAHEFPIEGDIVVVERDLTYSAPKHAAARLGGTAGSMGRVRTLQDVDGELQRLASDLKTRFVAPGKPTYAADDRVFPWSVDGVVNNVDNEDEFNEYKEHTIANVAVQGPCRLRHDADARGKIEPKGTHTLATVLVGLLEVEDTTKKTFAYRLLRFTNAEIARNASWFRALVVAAGAAEEAELVSAATNTPPAKVAHFVSVWTVGRVLDANQSPGMVTLNVGVSRLDVQYLDAVPDYQKVEDVSGGTPSKKRVGVYVKRVQGNSPFYAPTDARLADGTEVRFVEEWTNRPPVRYPEETLSGRYGPFVRDGADVANLRKVLLASGWP